MDAGIERLLRAFGRLDGHCPGHVGDLRELPGPRQGIDEDGGADLRAVDEREAFLRLEAVRLQADLAEGRSEPFTFSMFVLTDL